MTRSVALALLLFACSASDRAPSHTDQSTAAPQGPLPPPHTVERIDLGAHADSADRIPAPGTSFGRADTIHAAVHTAGLAHHAALVARWYFVRRSGTDTLIDQTTRTISPTGPALSAFEIRSARPWPQGTWRIEILIDGNPAGRKLFRVR